MDWMPVWNEERCLVGVTGGMTKRFCRFLQQGTVLAIAVAISISNPAHADLIVSPEAVILAGNRSNKISTTLTFSDDEGDTGLKIAVSDLRRADGAAFVPANKIVITPPEITVPKGSPAQVTITIDLGQASANGEFAGSLYLYRSDGRQVIPLTVRVKEDPVWPWMVMIVGVGLGSLLSIYKVDGRSRDELVVQMGYLHNQMNGDPKLSKDFKASIDAKLRRVTAALKDKDWETAKTEVAGAKELWNRWDNRRDDWVAQLDYGDKFLEENKADLEAEKLTLFMQGVKNNVDAVYRRLRAGQYAAPEDLNKDFSDIGDNLLFYREGHAAITRLKKRRQVLSTDKANEWLAKLQDLETELNNSKPDEDSRTKWQKSFDDKQTKLDEAISTPSDQPSPQQNALIVLGRSGTVMNEVQQVALVPTVSKQTEGSGAPQQADQAEKNLWWFNQTSRCVAIIFLAWLGMIELYSGKPTFGAEPLRDYFALLAWGFGAELTRESVARTTQELGLPLVK
jgi:hypothetical protein